MFKIEETSERDTFRVRSVQHAEIVFEVNAITEGAYEHMDDFREYLEYLLASGPKNAVQRLKEVMQHDEIRSLVTEVRAAQKAYFRNRTTGNLEKSKSLERELDQLLADLNKPETAQTLFL